MSGTMRLAYGGLVDRTKPVGFSFDGRKLSGIAGDTLASALMANGDRQHRPHVQAAPAARHLQLRCRGTHRTGRHRGGHPPHAQHPRD